MRDYEVVVYMDTTYQVVETEGRKVVFQGSLADCQAWLWLKEREYL